MRFREMISEARITDTPQFKAWFAGSKVVFSGTDRPSELIVFSADQVGSAVTFNIGSS